MIDLTPLQKLPKNVGDLGKLIVAKDFKKSPKVQKSPNLVTLIWGKHLSHGDGCDLLTKSRHAFTDQL